MFCGLQDLMRSTQTVTCSRTACVVYWKPSVILTLFWTKKLTAAYLQILLLIYGTVERDVMLPLVALSVSCWIWMLSVLVVFCNVVSVVLKRWRVLHFSVCTGAPQIFQKSRSPFQFPGARRWDEANSVQKTRSVNLTYVNAFCSMRVNW